MGSYARLGNLGTELFLINLGFTYQIIRSKRKTIAIVVKTSGEVIIRAPRKFESTLIYEMVQKKRDWILKKLNQFAAQKTQFQHQLTFVNGKGILFQGNTCSVQVHLIEKKRTRIEFQWKVFHVFVNENLGDEEKELSIRKKMMEWFKKQAFDFISLRIEQIKLLINVKPKKITIRNQKTRWGSCSSSGALNFNLRLLMAPVSVIDYVIIHELCHLKEKSHSKQFWALVNSILPDYKEKKQWLKTHRLSLLF